MPFLAYKARNQDYNIQKGFLYVPDKKDIYDELKKTNLQLVKASEPSVLMGKLYNKAFLYQHYKNWFLSLAQLLQSGIPLLESLQMVAQQTKEVPLKKILYQVIYDIQKGQSFSKSLSHHSEFIDDVVIQKIDLAEKTGTLDAVLYDLYEYFDWKTKMQESLMSVLRYPIFLLLFLVTILFSLNAYLLPELIDFLNANKIESSAINQWIALKAVLPFSAVMLSAFVGIGYILYKKNAIPQSVLKIAYYLPFGKLYYDLQLAKFFQTFGFMLQSGLDLKSTFSKAKNDISLSYLKEDFEKIEKALFAGEKIGRSFSCIWQIDPIIVRFVELGEASGKIEQNLLLCSKILHDRFKNKLDRIISMIQPFFILLIGSLLLWIVMVFLLPIYDYIPQGVS